MVLARNFTAYYAVNTQAIRRMPQVILRTIREKKSKPKPVQRKFNKQTTRLIEYKVTRY